MRSAPVPYAVRAHAPRPSRKLAVPPRRTGGSSLAPLTRGTCTPPASAAAPGSPALRCEVSPVVQAPSLSGSAGKGLLEWGLRRCRRGCPLLGLTLCGAISSRAPPPQGSLFPSPPKQSLGRRAVEGVSRGFGVGGGPAVEPEFGVGGEERTDAP